MKTNILIIAVSLLFFIPAEGQRRTGSTSSGTESRTRTTTTDNSKSKKTVEGRRTSDKNNSQTTREHRREEIKTPSTQNKQTTKNYHSNRKPDHNKHATPKHYQRPQKPHRSERHYRSHRPIEYRAQHYPYRHPVHHTFVWDVQVYNNYCRWYPGVVWHYKPGTYIEYISAYDAYYYIGEVRGVYGKVYETYYVHESDEYVLYIGDEYPYHDFSIIVPGKIARKYSIRPELYFYREHVYVKGYITSYDRKPEVVVRHFSQLDVY